MRRIIVGLLLFLSAGCAADRSAPDWVDGRAASYPAAQYLIGRGQGNTASLARDRARADLAKIFEVRVREHSYERLEWQQGQGADAELQTRIMRDIRAQVGQVIKGMQIVGNWHDREGDYYALAVLDRQATAKRLRKELMTCDRETQQNIVQAQGEDFLPEKVHAAYQALRTQQRCQQSRKMVQIVDPTGNGMPAIYSMVALKNDLETLLDRWHIALVVEHDELGGAKALLAGALANTGVRYQADPAGVDYLLKAEVSSEQLKTADGWYWVRGSLKIFLLEADSGNQAGSHQWFFKTSARQAEMARIRAEKQLAEILDRELLETLMTFGAPQV